MIQTITYKDWYINQKRVPDIESEEYKSFYDFHKQLCWDGFYMEGEFINPFLYWHLNMWHTEVDVKDTTGRINQKYANPYLRDNEWIVTNEIHKANTEHKGLLILGIRRLAKALKNTEFVYTANGPKEIGNISVGERIFDHNGKLVTVTGVFPQGRIGIYKIEFRDGRVIHCCENHIWRVRDRRYNKIKDLSVKELLKIYKKPRIHNGYKDGVTRNIEECFFAIPNNKGIQYSSKKLEIDPYFLGLWLGDGNKRNLGVTSIDNEIINFIEEYAKELGLKVRVDEQSFFITSGIKGGRSDRNILTNKFKNYNLFNNKHIPNNYLYSSYSDRLKLLQGLMDSDGCCTNKNGTICFTSNNRKLSENFYSLCRSLGINVYKREDIAKLYGKDCGKIWRFNLFTELPIFKLRRKLDNIRIGNKGKQSKINWTSIENIEYVFDDYATCITVDNEDKLFLTTDYTVTHNSVIEASYIGWGATFDENSQNVISGLNGADIKLVTDKLDKGLTFVPDAWKWQRIEDNWKNQVTLGIKTKSGERMPFSQILIRNLDEGNNEEAIAGTKPRKLIIDEIGKGNFLRALQAAIPGFTTSYGEWGCSPILTGTGGDMTKFMDAKSLMFDVSSFNFMEYRNENDSKRTHGLFIGHKYRMEAKKESSLGDYLKKPEGSLLYQVPLLVSDFDKAEEITNKNLERAKKAGDRVAYLKEKMYYPKEVDDIFLNESSNIFDIEAAKAQQSRLIGEERTGIPIILEHDGEKIVHKFTDKQAISFFPVKPNESKDAPIIIYEFPVEENPPYGLYVAGVDPYRQGKAAYSDSLGAIYIYKRMHSITGEAYQDMFVASYVARPEKKSVWEEQARLLIKYYNARTLCENDDISFIEYMKAKGDAHYLEPQPMWLKRELPNTTVNRDYGVHRSAEKIRDFLHNRLKKYLEETIYKETDTKSGSVIKEYTGVRKILDVLLLEEIIQFNEDGNFDRLIAAELAITQAVEMDPIMGIIGGEEDVRYKSIFGKKNFKGQPKLFSPTIKSSFSKPRKLFT